MSLPSPLIFFPLSPIYRGGHVMARDSTDRLSIVLFFLHALVRHVACLQEIRKRLSLDQMPQWVPVAHFRSLSTSCASLKNWTLSAVVGTLLLKIQVSQHEQAEQGHTLRHRGSFVLVVCVVSRCALLLSICAAIPTFQEHWRVKPLVCLVEASFTWS